MTSVTRSMRSSAALKQAQAAMRAAEARFVTNNPLSKAQHELAVGSLPGGNTRTLLHTSPFPLCMRQGKGAHLWDLDGHRYVDLVGELSAGLYGHSHPAIRRAALSVLADVGLSLGATTVHEQRLAAQLCARFGLARVRMTNSGTEANLHALAAARRFTGRRKVVVFAGGYHGGVLSFPHPRPPTSSSPDSGGRQPVPAPAPNTVDAADFVVVPRYNDLALAKSVIDAVGDDNDLAAVLVEPMQGAGGCLPGEPAFLRGLQEAARARGALFVLDEVMTSRLAPAGLGAGLLGLAADLVTLGKYLGGGFAFGAFGGREDVMAVYDPRRTEEEGPALAHSGTFNNNTMAMCCGHVGLTEVFTPEVCVAFNRRGDAFRERLREAARGSKLSVTGRGSLIGLHFTEDGTEAIKCGGNVITVG